mmetsp:Transcript_69746/g.168715  ORF Transcript_69746/g.168715 Transcript_69746/m.168715 type:complete len:272 (+) Transcript_69746:59-874(+)
MHDCVIRCQQGEATQKHALQALGFRGLSGVPGCIVRDRTQMVQRVARGAHHRHGGRRGPDVHRHAQLRLRHVGFQLRGALPQHGDGRDRAARELHLLQTLRVLSLHLPPELVGVLLQRLARGQHHVVLTRGSSHLLLQRLHCLRALRDACTLLPVVSFQATNLQHRLLRLLLHGFDGARILRALVQLGLEPSRLTLEHVIQHVHGCHTVGARARVSHWRLQAMQRRRSRQRRPPHGRQTARPARHALHGHLWHWCVCLKPVHRRRWVPTPT